MSQARHKVATLTQADTVDDAETTVAELIAPSLSDLLQRRRAGDRIVSAVVEQLTPDGIAMVVLSGDTQARAATSLVRFSSAAAASAAILGRTVLVLDAPSATPVIIGIVSDRLWDPPASGSADAEAQVQLPPDAAKRLQVDKRRLDLEANDEIRLICGKSSLLLRRDGTVIIKGVTITSRASQTNKIRGATVNIN